MISANSAPQPYVCFTNQTLLLLLLSGELLTERCHTDDLMPSIPFLCPPPSRVDPKVLWLNVLIYHSQPGGSWTTRRSPPNTGWQQWWYWWQMMIVGKTDTCNLETGAGSGCEKNVLWFEVHVRYVLTTHVLQCWCWQTTHTHHNVTDRQTDRQTSTDALAQ